MDDLSELKIITSATAFGGVSISKIGGKHSEETMKLSRRSLLFGTACTAILGSGLAFGQAFASATMTIGTKPEEHKLLVQMIRVVYPHDRFGDGPYERTADAVVAAANKTPGKALMLAAGLKGLKAHKFSYLDSAAATTHIAGLEGSDFFSLVHGTATVALYNDHEVWDLLGYEGPSFDQGGYINRGFNDLNWLPEPRITEL